MSSLTSKRYKTYRMGVSLCRLGHAPGVEIRVGGGEGSNIFSEHGHVAYQIEGHGE